MRGTNPIRPPVNGYGTMLEVVEIFPTLQGEGIYVGMPAVFIRLGGCNLACNFCDTEFESFQTQSLDIIMAEVTRHEAIKLVVITGGEPLRQPIGALCAALLAAGRIVQIETNGTLWRDLPDGVDIVCSPKVSARRYHVLRPDLLARVSALKFLISAQDEAYHDVPDVGQGGRDIPVYLQPMDAYDEAMNAENRARAVALCLAHGYRLSLQTHKILGIA
jgi:7-carboxy-7-deazaguanine synthase